MAQISKANCQFAPAGRRRIFWATRADGCGKITDACGTPCGRPGLSLVSHNGGVTISNADWVEGVILNKILTRGRREESYCGFLPGNRGGHWSDVFRPDGEYAGSRLLDNPVKSTVAEATSLAEATLAAELDTLVQNGIAHSVDVRAVYNGNNRYHVTITVVGDGIENLKVGLTGARLANGWAWGTQKAA